MGADLSIFKLSYPDPWEDPKSRSPNSGLQYSYGVDYGTKGGIYFLDPPRGRGRLFGDPFEKKTSIHLWGVMALQPECSKDPKRGPSKNTPSESQARKGFSKRFRAIKGYSSQISAIKG